MSIAEKNEQERQEMRLRLARQLCAGLSSNRIVLPDLETETEFQDYKEALMHDLKPKDALETLIADRIVIAQWELQRLEIISTYMMTLDMDEDRLTEEQKGWRKQALRYIDNPDRLQKEIRETNTALWQAMGAYRQRKEILGGIII